MENPSGSGDSQTWRETQEHLMKFVLARGLGKPTLRNMLVDVVFNIADQTMLPVAVYRMLDTLRGLRPLNITEDEFVRMWRTLLLSRVQDVYGHLKCQRIENKVASLSGMLVPAPLSDLAGCIGQYRNSLNGKVYHTVPPPEPETREDWRTLDSQILEKWSITMARLRGVYTMRPMPYRHDCDKKPLMCYSYQSDGELTTVKASYALPDITPEEDSLNAIMTMINEQLYKPVLYPAAECNFPFREAMNKECAATEYACSYVSGSIAVPR